MRPQNIRIVTMMKPLMVLTSLLQCVSSQLVNGYLPPTPSGGGQDVVQSCPPVYTSTSYITSYVTRTSVLNIPGVTAPAYTSTIYSTQVVPSVVQNVQVVQRTVVVPSNLVQTQYRDEVVTRTSTVPGEFRDTTVFVPGVVVSTLIQQEVSTIETTIIQPTTRLQTSFFTRTEVQTERVPQVQVVTSQIQVPGRQVTVTRTQEVTTTRQVDQQAPPVIRTSVIQSTIVQTRFEQVPGVTRTSTQILPSTRVVPVESVVRRDQPQTIEITSTRLFERTLYRTRTTTIQIPQPRLVTSVFSSQVFRTQDVTVTSTQVVTRTVPVSRQVPGQQVFRTVYRTNTQYVTVPGRDIAVSRTQYVDRVVTRERVSTQIVPQRIEKTVYITETCSGGGGYQSYSSQNTIGHGGSFSSSSSGSYGGFSKKNDNAFKGFNSHPSLEQDGSSGYGWKRARGGRWVD